ncbi:MAG: U32 family peptidase [Alphaproteobacteria bacterium]|nr:U32 family peptidase [Alphaproteobacteria bacterium]
MRKPELLAPAGDLEAGYAALYFGADAVYLGLKSFSARAGATNFTPSELNEFTAYAHHLDRKVYVTVNTVIQEHELDALLQTLDVCSAAKVDGIILQDMGVARVIKESYPELVLHASTQMAVHNKEGALALKKLGFSRVVLARELTQNEIEEIAAIPGLETEAFIHGALCYAYSGLCLFSSMVGGRSANRGKCQYPCRALFQKGDKETHCFSMKDMALGEAVLKMPVTSLKIEGRKKKALYVAAVVDYYRQILDTGHADPKRAENIKQIFSRAWTTFHFNGKNNDVIDPDFVGHRGLLVGKVEAVLGRQLCLTPTHPVARYDGLQIDLPGDEKPFGFSVQEMAINHKSVFEVKAGQHVQILLPPHSPFMPKGAPVYLASSSRVKGAYDFEKPKPGQYKTRPEVDVKITLTKDKIVATVGDVEKVLMGPFASAQNADKMNESVLKTFEKDNDYAFAAKVVVQNKDNIFAPVSKLNDLRRQLYGCVRVDSKHGVLPPVITHKGSAAKWLLKTDDLKKISLLNLDEFAEVLVELRSDFDLDLLKQIPKNKVRLSLPTVERAPQNYSKLIQKALASGYHKWEIGNWWGFEMLPTKGIDLTFDAPFYMLNTQSTQFAKELGASRVTLSVEDTLENLKVVAEKSALPTTLVVYQDVPLFTSANCIKNACKTCDKSACVMPLKNGGQTYFVAIQNCQLKLYSEHAFYVGEDRSEVPADFYRVDFVNRPYTPEKVNELWNKIKLAFKINNTTSGNLRRSI